MPHRLLYPVWILGAAALVFFTNLGGAALWDDDEPYYAECAREMLERDDLVVPMFNGQMFSDKPPLMYWTMIGGFKLFGVDEFGARCGAALCGIATALGTYFLGRRLFAPEVGLWAGLIVASTFVFTISARAATVDCTLALLSVGAMLALVYGKLPRPADQSSAEGASAAPATEAPLSWPAASLMYACLAVGILAKGPIGLLLPAASIGLFLMVMNKVGTVQPSPDAASTSRWRRVLGHIATVAGPINFLRSLRQMRPLLGIVVVLAVAAPWFVLVGLRTNGEWPAEFFGTSNVRAFAQPRLGHSGPFWYYLPAILIGFFPWSVFSIPTIADAVRCIGQRHRWLPGYVLLACWAAVPIVFWSICSSKLPHYMVPIAPALALAVGAFLYHWFRNRASFSRGLIWVAWGSAILTGICFIVVMPIIAAVYLPGEGLLGLIGLILIAGGAVSLYLVRQQRRQAAMIVFAAMSVLLMTVVFGFATLRIDRHQNAKQLIAAIRRDCPGEPKLAAFGNLEKSQVFYSGHPVPFVTRDPDELHRLVGNSLTYVFTDTKFAEHLQSCLPGQFDVLIRQRRFLRGGEVIVLVHRPHDLNFEVATDD